MQANACYVFICRPSTDGAFSFVALRQMGGFEFDSNKAGNGGSDLVLGPSHGVQPQVLPWPRSRLDSDLNRSSSKSRFLPFQQSVLSIPFKLPQLFIVPRIRVPSYFVLNFTVRLIRLLLLRFCAEPHITTGGNYETQM